MTDHPRGRHRAHARRRRRRRRRRPHRDVAGAQRVAGAVRPPARRPTSPAARGRAWPSSSAFTGFYIWFGYWLVVKMHVVGFETLDRLNRALMIWHNDPAKLSALGFDYPPLATLLISPLAIFPAVTSSLIAVPIASAVFAGLTMMSLNTMMRRAQLIAPLRYGVLIALGANPLFLLYAAGGARQFIWIAFVVVAMGALVAWYVTADVRYVMLAGLAFSVAALSGYASLLWFVLTALMIGAILAKLGADGSEVEGTTIGFAVPTAYVIALWTVFNLILLLQAVLLDHRRQRRRRRATPAASPACELFQDTVDLVLYGAPIAIVVLPVADLRRRRAQQPDGALARRAARRGDRLAGPVGRARPDRLADADAQRAADPAVLGRSARSGSPGPRRPTTRSSAPR